MPAEVRVGTAAPVPLASGWETGPTRHGPWTPVTVPHVLDARPVAERFDGTTAWYRLRFRAPSAVPGGGWALRFETVRRRARVLLNGTEIGRNDDPYTPFAVPAAGLRPGADNLLEVEVDYRRTPGLREGWWNWGGITRRVALVPRGRVSFGDVGLLGKVDCEGLCRAAVVVDGRLTNRTGTTVRPVLAVRLRPPGGGPVSERTVVLRALPPGDTARLRVRVPVRGTPKLWSPERPRLYAAAVEARIDGRVEERLTERVGLRTVRVRDGHLELNGRRLQLRGASIQEDVPGRGPALTDADVERIVADLKAVGANVTRAHYLLDERLLDRFDEEGILVWSQAPVYHRDVQLRTPEGRARELGVVRRTVLEARRHPSVLTHSVANELSPAPDDNATTRRWLDDARRLVRELDPSVPVSVDLLAWPGYPRQETYARFDVLGLNSYFGWYAGGRDRSTADLADLEPFLRGARAAYPGQALVMTEFGAESTMDGPVVVKETFAFQAAYVRANLDVIGRLPFMSGAIYWTLREFAVKPNWDGGAQRESVERDAIHNKGLLTYASGARKPAWAVAARAFAATPLYRSPAPWAIAPALDARPPAAAGSAWTLAATAALLATLLALAAVIVRLVRGLMRAPAGAPASRDADGSDAPAPIRIAA